MIKEGRRRRYIGFVVSNTDDLNISKDDMIHAIRKKCKELYKDRCKKMGIFLVRFDGFKGITRCKNIEKDNVINLMNSIDTIDSKKVKIKTIGTSGTIKSLIKKHFTNN